MAAFTTRVEGYREVTRALQRVNRSSKATLYAGLREAAEPIAADTRGRLTRYQGISLGTIGPKATQRGVSITQRAKKVTGKRPDFGALQMTRGFIPAATAGQGEIADRVEAAFSALIQTEGP